ncbi:hypothetical protein [Actinomadura madurae]|uniref:hypothetical protein n=1 Tax=Actinomadura madurae TaxID=1993 RepID=UPI003999F3C0
MGAELDGVYGVATDHRRTLRHLISANDQGAEWTTAGICLAEGMAVQAELVGFAIGALIAVVTAPSGCRERYSCFRRSSACWGFRAPPSRRPTCCSTWSPVRAPWPAITARGISRAR